MTYQDCIAPAQAPDETIAGGARLADANINARTGLATDYLNHFNEAIMLLEMLSPARTASRNFSPGGPMSYREHFEASRFKSRELAIAAYDAAAPGRARRPRRAHRDHDRGARGNARGAVIVTAPVARRQYRRGHGGVPQAADRTRRRRDQRRG